MDIDHLRPSPFHVKNNCSFEAVSETTGANWRTCFMLLLVSVSTVQMAYLHTHSRAVTICPSGHFENKDLLVIPPYLQFW